MRLVEFCVLTAGSVAVGLVLAGLCAVAVLAIGGLIGGIVLEPWRRWLQERRDAAERAAAAVARIDADADLAVRNLEQAYLAAVGRIRDAADDTSS